GVVFGVRGLDRLAVDPQGVRNVKMEIELAAMERSVAAQLDTYRGLELERGGRQAGLTGAHLPRPLEIRRYAFTLRNADRRDRVEDGKACRFVAALGGEVLVDERARRIGELCDAIRSVGIEIGGAALERDVESERPFWDVERDIGVRLDLTEVDDE